jgi:methanol--5-hydroxybenzimidazolylcobamide Co-methyltransferase
MPTGLRVTPNDVREFARPPLLRTGPLLEAMLASLAGSARAGADLLAVESTGGMELHDRALLGADLPGIVLALGVLAPRDMAFLWDAVVATCAGTPALPSGDSACGFANTAMALADQRHIPRVLAALEGSEAACAHLSPIGNVARATADLWSNESVANVELLGGMAPTVSTEQLVYACRVLNVATAAGPDTARTLRDLYVASDAGTAPQAVLLRPDVVVRLAAEVVAEEGAYRRTVRVGRAALEVLRGAVAAGELTLARPEARWLDRLSRGLDELPEDGDALLARVEVDPAVVRLDEYGLAAAGAAR